MEIFPVDQIEFAKNNNIKRFSKILFFSQKL